MMVPMDKYAINKCSLAYISYLFIALFLFLGVVADTGALNFDFDGGWMYIAAIWMSGLALLAAPAGLLLSLLLWRHWSSEWGVIALPLLLVLWIGVFAYEESQSGQHYWLNIVIIVYVILAVAFAARWFLYSRKRAA